MKDGWEIKKLGEVCELYQPKTISSEQLVMDGSYPVYGANGVIGRYNQYNHEESEVLVTCRGATCGTINVSVPYSWINGNAMVVRPIDIREIRKQYLRYVLTSIDWKNVITGAAQPQITRQSLSPVPIPIPPLPEQERIVSELDCINGILEKKREQIKELDALAQSIFYHMFGDPVTNEKGWEVKKLGELSNYKLSYGSGASAVPYNGEMRYVRITDITDSGKLNEDKVSPSVVDEKYLLNNGDLLFARSGATVGKTYLYDESDGKAIYAGYLIRFIPNTEYLLPSYIFGYTKTTYYKAFIERSAQAVAQPNINAQQYSSLEVLLPPLSLQQSFATKIEAIEKQKELIKRSIAEVETLLASRMQPYFNS